MSLVLIERTESIVTLTLNRPERHNSLVPELLREFIRALGEVSEARALVLQANGRSFSTGGDVRAFYEHRAEAAAYARDVVGLLNEAIEALLRFPAPTIVAVNGVVTGGSIGLVLACDLVIVSPQASFTPYYNVVGFSPDGGWTALLPEVIGSARTAECLLANATITAQQAVEWGLANRMAEGNRVGEEAQRIAQQISLMKIGSVRRSIQLLRARKLAALPKLQAELDQFVEQIGTDEALAGLREFLKESYQSSSFPRASGGNPVDARLKHSGMTIDVSQGVVMKGLEVGQNASLTQIFTAEAVAEYRALTGDVTAPESVPGPLLGGLLSCVLGTQLPGRGTNWLKQSYRWGTPAPIGLPITVTVEITRLRPDKHLVNLRNVFKSTEGKVIGEGETLVGVSDLQAV